ncbi:MAG: helix-turn-helix domain-containing protein [Hyphomicrobium sp.]
MNAESLVNDELLTTAECAELLRGISKATLERFRCHGTGPPFIKLGITKNAKVVYSRRAVLKWAASRQMTSTESYST